ncbi:MAG: homoaconitase [candidate division Zixibacteria bacterium]|nr:homoaconitase [candidate division Zixibacteria bacterium]
MGQTVVEKLATAHAVGLKPGEKVVSGDFIRIRPKHIMTHDNTSAVMSKFKSIGAARVADPRQPVFAIDHDIQNTTPDNLAKYAKIEAFAKQHGIDFYPAGTGISHQVMVEYGYVTPGSMVVGSDSHSNLYGAAAALGTPVVRTDAAAIWATGQTWWQVPPVARVTLSGELRPGVVGKDVIIALCGLFNHDEVLNMAIEFNGDGIAGMSMDQRMSIANMTTEWGALAGIFPFDTVLRDYLYGRADFLVSRGTPRYNRAKVDEWYTHRTMADSDAHYAIDLTLDLSTVIPHVSGPNHVKTMVALPEIEAKKVQIHKAYLLSCVNARFEDLAEAAQIVKGKKVAEGVKFYVAAASANIQKQAEEAGHWQSLSAAGAIMLPSGCGPCIGLGEGTLDAGEVGISATNRNFKGRMGHRDAQVYLGSPAVVAASAIAGYIASPTRFENITGQSTAVVHTAPPRPAKPVEIVAGFPAAIHGRALWLPVDNLNTDGIYGGAFTYKDNLTRDEMAAACMLNYDPNFQAIAVKGDIIVAGRNFGTGSSREQAATALDYRGIQCVIAASFNETYKRNAFNNGFVVFECPTLVDFLRETFRDDKAPTIVGPTLDVDYQKSMIKCDGRDFPFSPLSTVAQELVVAGGAENVVKKQLPGT